MVLMLMLTRRSTKPERGGVGDVGKWHSPESVRGSNVEVSGS
jgi:hypothetical protein